MEPTIRQQLESLADPVYQRFQQKLLPGVDGILGVRIPQLREIAKCIGAGDWRAFLSQAQAVPASASFFEEIMLEGLVIGLCSSKKSNGVPMKEALSLVSSFVPKIQNWAVCDIFCGSLKFTEKVPAPVWDFLQAYVFSRQEYELRFAVVMLLSFYLTADYLPQVLRLLDQIRHEGYYVKMAVAWALSMAYLRFPEEVSAYLDQSDLDDFTYNKTLQKITESRRVSPEEKEQIRKRKRK